MMTLRTVLIGLLGVGCFAACTEVAPPAPYGALPSERQLRWHEMETYSLIHYTPTTYQNKEWGFGDADTSLFNPSDFDAKQIAEAAASAGFKGLISVAKHHDGFCLWPTATTDYSVAHSPWKNGKGDMVKEFMEATHAAGMHFGVYLSAWDRHDVRYGTPAYADAYRAQLTELMTGYGDLFTSWHDGANGGDGYYGGANEVRKIDRATYYAWEEKTWPIVRQHQPMAMIFSDIGPDMRWVGNEYGFAGETSWATITPKGLDGRKPVPGDLDDSNLTSGDRGGDFWIPAECDVPHRPGWFYHPEQDSQVKGPQELFEIYLKSVGRGGNMNLGLAPMPEGRLHANDVASLKAFGEKLAKTFASDYAQGAQIKASNIRGNSKVYGVHHILDDDRYSYYASDDEVLDPVLEIELDGEREFDLIRLRENIKLGQRLDSVRIDVWQGDEWKRLASATSIGATRLIKMGETVKATKLRVQLFAPVAPTLSDFALFREAEVDYSVAGGNQFVKLRTDQFKILSNASASEALDADVATFARWEEYKEGVVFEIVGQPLLGFSYLPRQDGEKEGIALKYRIEGSHNREKWTLLSDGEFSNVRSNPIEQIVRFGKPIDYRYIRFIPLSVEGATFTAAEFGLLK